MKRWLGIFLFLSASVSFSVQGQGTAPPADAPPAAETEGSTTIAIGGEGRGFLGREVRRLHATHASGAVAIVPMTQSNLQTNARYDVRFPVRGGTCYVAIAAALPSAREVDLYVFDPFGQQRGRDTTQDAAPFARFCPSVAGEWRVQLHMFNGYGRVAAQVFRLPGR